jgi:hypothetical protein
MAKKKVKSKKSAAKKSSKPAKKKAAKAKAKPKKAPKATGKAKKATAKPKPRPSKGPNEGTVVSYRGRGLGSRSAGQSGDTQGLPASPDVDSESVEELLEEGQSFEAEVLDGVENAPDADEGEIRTKEVPEDDVPEEYQEEDED